MSRPHETTTASLWYCETCAASGGFDVAPGTDVMSVVYFLGDVHRAASPDCEAGTCDLRTTRCEGWYANIREGEPQRDEEG